MMRPVRSVWFFLPAAVVLLSLNGCQTLREISALRDVSFALDRVTDMQLAGVDVQRIRRYEDLSAGEVLRLGAAVAARDLPLSFRVHVAAENPPENTVNARLVRMDWTLFLDDTETVSGVFDQVVSLQPGVEVDLPIQIDLEVFRFFDRNARDLVDLALAVSGQGGAPTRIKLQARPTIDTSLGPVRYPGPITILSRSVGS